MSEKTNTIVSEQRGISVLAETEEREQIPAFLRRMRSLAADVPCEVFVLYEAAGISEKLGKKIRDASSEADGFRVKLIDMGGHHPAAAFNAALQEASGSVIHITDTSCKYEAKGLRAVMDVFRTSEDTGIVSMQPYIRNVKEKEQKELVFEHDVERIDLQKTPQFWSGYLFGLFFRHDVIDGIRFREELKYEYRRAFLADAYSRVSGYTFVPYQAISSAYPDTDYYNYPPQYEPDWYLQELEDLAEYLTAADAVPVRQHILMDFVRLQFACNVNNRNKGLLIGDDLQEYKQKVVRTLQKVDDEVIGVDDTSLLIKRLPQHTRTMFLCMKHDREHMPIQSIEKKDENGETRQYLVTGKAVLLGTEQFHVNIRAMNIKGDQLVIDGELIGAFIDDPEKFHLVAKGTNGEEIPTVRETIYNLYRIFGVTVRHGYNFSLTIPLGKKKCDYTIWLTYQDLQLHLRWRFIRAQARLSHAHPKCFWNTGKYCIRYDVDGKFLRIEVSNPLKTLVNELRYDISVFRNRKTSAAIKRGIYIVVLRLLYYLTKPIYGHRNIWITFDQLFKGGDNGEYFYRYVCEHGDKRQKIYYIANEDSREYRELKEKYGTVLAHNSWKGRLISLHSKLVFTTRAGGIQYLGFAEKMEPYYRGMFNFDMVCLQHGLSIQKIAEYQNRLFDNLKYYFCVSKYEVENLSKPIYGYTDKSVLKLTGAPRYDGLHSDPKKQVIITPTWRRNVTSGTNTKGKNHEYSENFKNTEYYRLYNRLINDEKLIETARQTGYRLIYLIHPILSPQINDFDKNDFLDIVPGSKVNYEKILTESAVMLTDHSGIMYDFAYQRKPLVYYHPDSLPPQYGEGGLKYDTMGFGPVCKTHEQVVDALCELMRNDCKLEKKYEERIDDFFAFDDFNNCARVYQAACEYQKNYQ